MVHRNSPCRRMPVHDRLCRCRPATFFQTTFRRLSWADALATHDGGDCGLSLHGLCAKAEHEPSGGDGWREDERGGRRCPLCATSEDFGHHSLRELQFANRDKPRCFRIRCHAWVSDRKRRHQRQSFIRDAARRRVGRQLAFAWRIRRP